MVDYHILNNKRFVLTKDSMDVVQLWQLDTLKCVHTFHHKSWEDTKKLLAESYDLVATKEQPLPHSWMRIDIKLGVGSISH